MLFFRVLGPLAVESDDVPIEIEGGRQRALLAALVQHAGTPVSVPRLAEVIWGDTPPRHPENAVQRQVARLRRRLPNGAEWIRTLAPGYVLHVRPSDVDAGVFEALLAAARRAAAERAADAGRLYDQCLDMWRGDAYEEFPSGPLAAAAARLDELRFTAQVERGELLLRDGQIPEALLAATALVAEHPLREEAVGALMCASAAAGRQAEALAAYERHRQAVLEELGVDPSDRLQALHLRVLRQELEPPVRPPAARAPGAARRRAPLPPVLAPLLGREADLRRLQGAVEQDRLVTITGPGGVGKTRLALEYAHGLERAGRPAQWVDLAPVDDRVVEQIAADVGADTSGSPVEITDAIAGTLETGAATLVLDNAEHVAEAVAVLVRHLLARAPSIGVVVTSRERLALGGERVISLGPLDLPDGPDPTNPAIQLFIESVVRLDRPRPVDAELADIAEICQRLDGLPLAIELAAARAASLGIAEVRTRVQEHLDLLGAPSRGGARHRTLRAVVDWSWGLLTHEEQVLFRRLAIFPSGFNAGAAESVCAGGALPRAEVARLLAQLTDRSLLQTAAGRFRYLFPIRVSAAERLDAARERAELAVDHARWALAGLQGWSRLLWTEGEPQAVQAIEALLPDLHVAWEHARTANTELAVALAGAIFDYAYFRQRIDLLAWSREVADVAAESPVGGGALAAAAAHAWATGRIDDATASLEAAGRGPAAGDDMGWANAINVSADLAMFRGRTEVALAAYEEVRQRRLAGGLDVPALVPLVSQAQALVYEGHTEEALRRLDGVLPQLAAHANPTALAFAYYVRGEARAGHDAGEALADYEAAVHHGRPAGSRLFTSLASTGAATLIAAGSDGREAAQRFRTLVTDWDDLGNEAAQWWTAGAIVQLLARTEAFWDAAVLAGAVLAAQDRRPTFGPEMAQLEVALARVKDALGSEFPVALAAGRSLTRAATMRTALAALERVASTY